MTDWPRLRHAYGSAEDIPALLTRIAADPDAVAWNDLWSALCHQGTVYSASFAALPWLATMAEHPDREQAVQALALAGGILAGAEQPHGAGDVRVRHAAEVATLRAAVRRQLRATTDRVEYGYLLEALLAFEGVTGWSEDLAWGLAHGEYEVTCPGCAADLFVVLGERGFFCASGDYALADDTVATLPLRPANPADASDASDPAALHGVGRRLYDLAHADGQPEVARTLTYVFGHGVCPDCATDFSVAERVDAERASVR